MVTHDTQQSHLTPLSTRTTNKELSAGSFMTKMMQSVGQSKFHVLRFEQPSFSFTTFIYRQHSFYFKPYFGEVLKKAT